VPTTTTIACAAVPGEGGLGRHFADLLRVLEARGELVQYYSTGVPEDAPPWGVALQSRLARILTRLPPARFDARLRAQLDNALFDRVVAAALTPAERHVGFAGQSLWSFRRAGAAGSERLLASPTAHVAHTARRYAQAFALYPLERPWLGEGLAARTQSEYELADTIQVASEYVRRSFLDAGVPPRQLERVELGIPDRFRPAPESRPGDGVFRLLYAGGLTVVKGVPVLLDAFARLPVRKAELTLVGGWSSRGMRRHVLAAVARDPRIRLVTGDPLPHLQRSDAYVHPSFQDGFGYAPMEALACGIPVVVSEDTGMKEHVREGETGYVVATGDADALVERLVALSARVA
jgi:glycosyltransferase involved in cell wall biosynthesis